MSARLLGMGFGCDMGTPHRKLILLKLIDACEDDGTRIFPAVTTIARAAQCSERQVQRELAGFVKVGLLLVVDAGGRGPGSTREYCLDVDMLRRVEAAGWRVTIEGAVVDAKGDAEEGDKGDSQSPLDESKGDSGDTIRVTGATNKGDSSSHPTPYYPSKDPSVERERAREAGKDLEPNGDLLDKLIAAHPQAAHDSQPGIRTAWRALTVAERRAAEAHFAAWMASRGARKAIAALSTYLREKRWTILPEARAAGGPRAPSGMIEPWSRAWWFLLISLIVRERATIGERDSPAAKLYRRQVSLAATRVGWRVEPEAVAEIEAKAAAYVAVPRDGPDAAAWRRHFAALAGVVLPSPDAAGFIFMPAAHPPPPAADDADDGAEAFAAAMGGS